MYDCAICTILEPDLLTSQGTIQLFWYTACHFEDDIFVLCLLQKCHQSEWKHHYKDYLKKVDSITKIFIHFLNHSLQTHMCLWCLKHLPPPPPYPLKKKTHSLFAWFHHLQGEPWFWVKTCTHCGAHVVRHSFNCAPRSFNPLRVSGTGELKQWIHSPDRGSTCK